MRISAKDLENLVTRLNELMNITGKISYNTVGAYRIESGYGVILYKIVSKTGTCRNVFSCGFIPKKDLYNRICAFIDGINMSESEKFSYYGGEVTGQRAKCVVAVKAGSLPDSSLMIIEDGPGFRYKRTLTKEFLLDPENFYFTKI